jgi:sialic acid synthase SpsE
MNTIQIGNIHIGPEYSPLVIPEIGINHGGSLEVAMAMVDAAAANGAKIVKHQTHIVEDEMSCEAKHIIPGNSSKSIYEVMDECALDEEKESELKKYAESKGMVFLSTPFSRAAANRLEKFGVLAYKIGSGEMNNFPLIEHIASFGRPMIVSTGMNDIAAIERTVGVLERKSVPYALMHTTNIYPTSPSQVRLGAMMSMAEHFTDIPFGLSDHTLNNNACIAAIALGASLVERHFTDDKARIGNDIVCSMDGAELRALTDAAEEVFLMRGGEKRALDEEQVTMDFAFATVVAIKDIEAGAFFSSGNIWVKRPGTGQILAKDFDRVLGKRVKCPIAKDEHIKWEMVEQSAL